MVAYVENSARPEIPRDIASARGISCIPVAVESKKHNGILETRRNVVPLFYELCRLSSKAATKCTSEMNLTIVGDSAFIGDRRFGTRRLMKVFWIYSAVHCTLYNVHFCRLQTLLLCRVVLWFPAYCIVNCVERWA